MIRNSSRGKVEEVEISEKTNRTRRRGGSPFVRRVVSRESWDLLEYSIEAGGGEGRRTYITNSPMTTIINKAKLNHPSTIALTPTPASILPFPRFAAIVAAATLAVCCHSTLTSTKIALTKMMASAIWLMNRPGRRGRRAPPSLSSAKLG